MTGDDRMTARQADGCEAAEDGLRQAAALIEAEVEILFRRARGNAISQALSRAALEYRLEKQWLQQI